MGLIRVLDSGKGVYLEKCSRKFEDMGNGSLSFEAYEKEIEEMLEECQPKPEIIGELSLSDKLLVWSEQKSVRHSKKFSKEYLDKNFSCYEKEYMYLEAIAEIFRRKYGYPKKTFRCVSDYDGDKMFYCCASFPLPEDSGALLQLTEEKYKAQLEELIGNLTGENIEVELEICEEYIKE